MLAVPYAVSECGYVVGVVLLICGGVASAFALHLLVLCSKKINVEPTSFYAVANAAVPKLTFLIDLAVAIKCFGVATSYLIVVGDLVPDAVGVIVGNADIDGGALMDRRLWISVFFIGIVVPLSCLRSLNSLRFTAVISVFIVWSITLIVSSYAWFPSSIAGNVCPIGIECHGIVQPFNLTLTTLKISTIFIFGYTCHQNIFAVCNELRHNTQARLDRVIYSAIAISMSVYLCMAISGYHTFGNKTHPNILTNYSASNVIMAVARLLVAVNVSFCFPLQCHPCRNSILELVAQYKSYTYTSHTQSTISTNKRAVHIKAKPSDADAQLAALTNNHYTTSVKNERSPLLSRSNNNSSVELKEMDVESGTKQSNNNDASNINKWKASELQISVLTGVITILSFTISMMVSNLGTVLAVVGATGSTTISYILPGLCYIKLHSQWNIKRILAGILLSAGLIIVPSSLSFIFILPGAVAH